MRADLAAEIRSRQERGEYRMDIDPEAKAIEILAFKIGLETQWLLDEHSIDPEKVLISFVRALHDGLTRVPVQPDS